MGLEITFPVTVEQPADICVSGKENRTDVFPLGDLRSGAGAAHGDPDRGMGLLIGPGPDIDLPGMEPTSLEIEGAVMGSPRLHYQVMGLPQPFRSSIRIGVGRSNLIRNAANETAVHTSPGKHVDVGHLLGNPDGLLSIYDGITQNQETRLLGLPGQDSQGDGGRRKHTRGGLVMFVQHNLQSHLVGRAPYVQIHVEKVCAQFRVEVAIWQVDSDRLVSVIVGKIRIGVFGKKPCLHFSFLSRGEFSEVLNEGFGLLDMGRMGSLGDNHHACARNHVPEGLSITWSHDLIAFSPDQQRGNVYAVQPVGKLGIVHVGFPGIKTVGDSVRSECFQFFIGHRFRIGSLGDIVPASLNQLIWLSSEDICDVTIEATSHLDSHRIHQNQLGESLGVDRSDLRRRPAAHREAHQDGIVQVQMVDKVQVEVDQVLKIIEVFRDGRARKSGVHRLDDFVPLRQLVGEGEPVDGSIPAMKGEEPRPGPFPNHGKVHAF